MAYSHHVSHQPITNFVISTYWNPHDVQVFDSTKTDGTHNLALINIGSDSGSGIAAPFNVPCYLAGTYWGRVRKYNSVDNSYLGLISTGLAKVKGMLLVPDTNFVAFGVNEAVLGLLDYDGMVFYSHTLVDADTLRVQYLTDTRVIIGSNQGGAYLEFVAFDQINPNRCLTFKNNYGLLCATCSPGTFLSQEKCVDTCPEKHFTNSGNNICEACGTNCKQCEPSTVC